MKKDYKPFLERTDIPKVKLADGTEIKPIYRLNLKFKKSKRVNPFNAKTFDLPK